MCCCPKPAAIHAHGPSSRMGLRACIAIATAVARVPRTPVLNVRKTRCLGAGLLANPRHAMRRAFNPNGEHRFPSGAWCSPFAHAKENDHVDQHVYPCGVPPAWRFWPRTAHRGADQEAARSARTDQPSTGRSGRPVLCAATGCVTRPWTSRSGKRSSAGSIKPARKNCVRRRPRSLRSVETSTIATSRPTPDA